MYLKQLSIFLENKSGRLADVLSILKEYEINILALTIADTSEYGILRLIVPDYQRTFDLIKSKDFTVNLTDVIAIKIPNKTGTLAQVLPYFAQEKMSVEYMYAFSFGTTAIIVLRPDNIEKAIEILQKQNIQLLTNKELSELK